MILIPQYRTSRRAAGGDITVIEEISQGNGTGTLPNLVFAGTPADGEILVAAVSCGSAPTTVPSGFTQVAALATGTERAYVYVKTAASETGTYTWVVGSRSAVMMARLSNGVYNTSGTNSGTAVTSLIMPSSGLIVPANSYAVAVWKNSSSYVPAVDNSFTIKISANAWRSCIASRKYTTGGASEQVTGSGSASANIGGIMAVFVP